MIEAELEDLCLEWFRETGWEVLHGLVESHRLEGEIQKNLRALGYWG